MGGGWGDFFRKEGKAEAIEKVHGVYSQMNERTDC